MFSHSGHPSKRILIVCGLGGLEPVFSLLQAGGVAAAAPAERTIAASIPAWHDCLFGGRAEAGPGLQPGKAWEQAAGDIFLANWQRPAWGWCDRRSTWLLDFWRRFDPDTRFVLVHADPERVMARALGGAVTVPFDPARVVSAWLAQERELLRFHLRNRERGVLIDGDEALGHPESFLLACAEALGLGLEAGRDLPLVPGDAVDPLAALLARETLRDFPEVEELRREIEASLSWRAPAEGDPEGSGPELAGAIASLRGLILARNEQARLAGLRLGQLESLSRAHAEQSRLAAERQQQIEQLTRALDEQARVVAQREGEIERLARARDEREREWTAERRRLQEEAEGQLKAAREELAQENELLLLQLHQVQEELEQYFLQHGEQKKLAEERQQQIEQLAKARDEQAKAAAQREAQIKTLSGERDQQAKLARELKAQLEQSTRAREESERNSAAERRRLQEAAESLKAAREELAQENELLLLQLHQVQEELEQYFLRCQDLEQRAREQEARWDRFLERHPDHCDWTALEPLAQEPSETRPAVRWRIRGLSLGRRALADFEVSTVVQDGHPALVFHRAPGSDAATPLLRWPPRGADAESLVLQPLGAETDRTRRWGILFGLAAADWRLARAVCLVLSDFLAAPNRSGDGPAALDTAFWRRQLDSLREQLEQLPPVWRYDRVRLKHEQVNPDYEHLWFSVEQAEFGARRWPEFEFRLSAAHVRPDGFSLHPKLEFPGVQQGLPQFENWFVESRDDYGPKFELRFDLGQEIMDVEVWSGLSREDQAQLFSMMSALPELLNGLEKGGVHISRPWADWQRLVGGMFEVLRQRNAERNGAGRAAGPAPGSAETAARPGRPLKVATGRKR